MHKLKMSFDEETCDYCNIRYPDKRSLKVHEFIHIDHDMDYFLGGSGILDKSDYLPKARNLLPRGIRNNRFLEINYRKVVINVPRYGKRCSKMLLISEAIDELLYLCKKYPLREPAADEKHTDEPGVNTSPIVLCSPPNYSSMTSICSSDSGTDTLSSSSESSYDSESESEQNEEQLVMEDSSCQKDEVCPDDQMDQTTVIEQSSDSGYSSSPQNHSEDNATNQLPESSESVESMIEINDLVKKMVTHAVGNDNYCKLMTEKLTESKRSTTGKSTHAVEFCSEIEKSVDHNKFKSSSETPIDSEEFKSNSPNVIHLDESKSISKNAIDLDEFKSNSENAINLDEFTSISAKMVNLEEIKSNYPKAILLDESKLNLAKAINLEESKSSPENSINRFPNELNSIIEKPVCNDSAKSKSDAGKLNFEVYQDSIAGDLKQIENSSAKVYSMPQILC